MWCVFITSKIVVGGVTTMGLVMSATIRIKMLAGELRLGKSCYVDGLLPSLYSSLY